MTVESDAETLSEFEALKRLTLEFRRNEAKNAEWRKKFATDCETLLPLLLELASTPSVHRAVVQVAKAVAEFADQIRPVVPPRRYRRPTDKTREGRPPIWQGYEGLRLVREVKKRQANKRCSLAQAVKWVIKNDPMFKNNSAHIKKLGGRSLEVRYQEAADYWAPFFDKALFDSFATIADKNNRQLKMAYTQLVDALRRSGLSVTLSDFP
jgi:hypothetical protein